MTRVAVISTYPSEGPSLGGIATYSRSLVTALRDYHDQDVVVLAQRLPAPTGPEARATWLPGPHLLPTIQAGLLRSDAEIVHLQHEPFLYGKRAGAVSALSLPVLIKRRALACCLTLHAVPFPSLLEDRSPATRSVRAMSAVFLRSVGRLARCVDTFIVHDESQAETLVRLAGISAHKVVTIPQGLHLSELPAPSHSSGPLRIGSFGFLAPYKDPGFLLDEFALLRRRIPDATLHFSLSRHPRRLDRRTVTLYETLMAKARSLPGVSTYGHLSDAALLSFLGKVDLLVNPYRYAVSTSAVLAQASGAGVPVLVLSESGEASRVPGWSFEYRRGSLAAALERQAAVLPEMRAQARELAQSRSWDVIAGLHRDQYDRLGAATRRR